MKIVLTGGGTGGHIYPNLAMLPYLKNFEVYYFGSNGMEKELAKKYNLPFYETKTVKFERKNLLPCRLSFHNVKHRRQNFLRK